MSGLKSLQRLLVLLACAAMALPLSAPAHALLSVPEAPAESGPQEASAPQIDDTQDSGADARIAARISSTFAQVSALSEVQVVVSDGVVSLSGTVPKDSDVAEAGEFAQRVEGVVWVDNALERDVSVESGITVFESLSDRASGLVKMLPLLLLALLVALAISAAGYLIAGVGGLWRKIAPNVFLAELIQSAIRFIFVIGGIVIALDIIGATALLGAVLGGAGVIGLSLGFAMRDTVENYVASLMLSLRQPFRANDHVMIDDMEGRVIRLTSRATVLMTLDGNHLRIPNSTVFKGVILNYTRNPQRRFSFDLGIDADDDPDAGRRLGRETLAALPFVLDEPAPEARVVDVGDSNIAIRFLGWVDQTEADWHKARSRAIAVVKIALEGAGFALPEPIYRLRFDARTGALPFANVDAAKLEETRGKEAERTKKAKGVAAEKSAAGDENHDVAPEDEIARMVDSERAVQGGETDLLDSGRPVE